MKQYSVKRKEGEIEKLVEAGDPEPGPVDIVVVKPLCLGYAVYLWGEAVLYSVFVYPVTLIREVFKR